MRVEEISRVVKGTILSGDIETEIINFSNDSKNIKEKCIYLALQGETKHGNEYIEDAFNNGAIGCITDREIEKEYNDKVIIKVEDTIKALQELAKYKREKYNIPVIAITGSVRENKHERHYCKCDGTKI